MEKVMEQEGVSKTIVVENDKIYVSASIKLGLKNFSSANIDFGITHVLKDDEDPEEIAKSIFEHKIMPQIQKFAGKLASVGNQMAKIIESKNYKDI
jgi:hypothetical protein